MHVDVIIGPVKGEVKISL